MSFDAASYAIGRKSGGGGGGGGNPNYVETVEGKLSNIFETADTDSATLYDSFTTNQADAYIVINDDDDDRRMQLSDSYTSGRRKYLIFQYYESESYVLLATAQAGMDTVTVTKFTPSGTDISSQTPCTLTIIHHPLPTLPSGS